MKIETTGRTTIEVIQGDTLFQTIEVEGIDFSLITKIVFSCSALKICKQLEKREKENAYALQLSSDETKLLPKITTTYDLTIFILDKTIQTAVFNGMLCVYEKKNKICQMDLGD